MAYRHLPAADADWRRSNQMKILNSDLARQLEATTMGARLWRIAPGQASTRHRHRRAHELYVLLEGTGRIRIDDAVVSVVGAGSALLVEPEHVRQLFNDTDSDQLWLVVSAPTEPANTLEMSEGELAFVYPDGPRALPEELGGGERA